MPNLQTASSKRACLHRQSGVGLIEVLIAVLVLSIGFMGVAALQLRSLSTNNSAMARSMAIIASYSILDAMLTDRDNALEGDYNTTVAADDCSLSGSLADEQLNDWCEQLGANLGAASTTTGTVNCSASGDCTVTIQFDDSRSGSGGDTSQQIVVKARI